MFRHTLRLSYAQWSKAVDEGDLDRQRRMLDLLNRRLNAAWKQAEPEMTKAFVDMMTRGTGMLRVTEKGVEHVEPIDLLGLP